MGREAHATWGRQGRPTGGLKGSGPVADSLGMSRRACAALLACLVMALGPAAIASADASLDHARKEREIAKSHLEARLKRLAALRRETRLLAPKLRLQWVLGEVPRVVMLFRQHWVLGQAVTRQQRLIRRLARRREGLADLIDELTPLKVCPVRGWTSISDDFGYWRSEPPAHVHQGNDVAAPYGAPIVAPFDGYAVAVTSELGGLGVKVYGVEGHAYNAHLSGLGTLGRVKAGTVVGYVGTTGNATSPHDHFEWHPWDGPAVDPHIYLLRACSP